MVTGCELNKLKLGTSISDSLEMAEGKAFWEEGTTPVERQVPVMCTPAPPSMQTLPSAYGCISLPPGLSADSPSKDLDGETTGLFVSDFTGLCAGEAGADFTGEPGSSAVVSFSPENTENHRRVEVKQRRYGRREHEKNCCLLLGPHFSWLELAAPLTFRYVCYIPGGANVRSPGHVLFPPPKHI